ncbi:MAG: hypothetical protein ABI378_00550 [Chitinophagaceae bacterium]
MLIIFLFDVNNTMSDTKRLCHANLEARHSMVLRYRFITRKSKDYDEQEALSRRPLSNSSLSIKDNEFGPLISEMAGKIPNEIKERYHQSKDNTATTINSQIF